MIRRIGVLFVLVLVFAGCSGGERDAVTVGDRSLSREEIMGYSRLVSELSQVYDISNTSTIDGAVLRSSAQDAIGVMARLESIEEQLGTEEIFTAAEREAAAVELKTIIDQQRAAVDAGQRTTPLTDFVVGYAPSSPSYDFVVDIVALNAFVANNPDVIEQIRTEAVAEFIESAEVESRIGIWDPAQGVVLRPSGISDAEAAIAEQEILQARELDSN